MQQVFQFDILVRADQSHLEAVQLADGLAAIEQQNLKSTSLSA
ncbi:hypothetical protein [Pseudomonas fakonensis]|nr:hypothetical protein [Pseudomonas fakonensis]